MNSRPLIRSKLAPIGLTCEKVPKPLEIRYLCTHNRLFPALHTPLVDCRTCRQRQIDAPNRHGRGVAVAGRWFRFGRGWLSRLTSLGAGFLATSGCCFEDHLLPDSGIKDLVAGGTGVRAFTHDLSLEVFVESKKKSVYLSFLQTAGLLGLLGRLPPTHGGTVVPLGPSPADGTVTNGVELTIEGVLDSALEKVDEILPRAHWCFSS